MSGALELAYAPQSVTMTLNDDIDISRGDMIVRVNNQPTVSQDVDVMVCWFNPRAMRLNGKYAIKHTTNDVRCMVKEIRYKIDVNTLERDFADKKIEMNDIGRVSIRTTKSIYFDSYRKNRITGSLVFIDEDTNETVGAGMII